MPTKEMTTSIITTKPIENQMSALSEIILLYKLFNALFFTSGPNVVTLLINANKTASADKNIATYDDN